MDRDESLINGPGVQPPASVNVPVPRDVTGDVLRRGVAQVGQNIDGMCREMVETEEQNLIPVALPVLGEMVQAGMVPTAEMALAEMAEKAASVAMLSLMGFLQAMEDKADREAPDTVETALEMLV